MDIVDDQKYFTPVVVKEMVGISTRRLYYWEKKGAVFPKMVKMGSRKFRRYTENDVATLKRVKQFLEEGYTLEKALEKAV